MTTTNEIQVFNNDTFGNLRTIIKDDEIWFVAKDVCDALELGNSRQALVRLEDDEKADVILNDGSQNRRMNIINEYGLYSLVLASRKPEAKTFKRWVTHDVLPSIRKTGQYSNLPQDYLSALKALVVSEEAKQKAELELAIAQPKANYTDNVLSSEGYMTATQIAKDYGKSAKWLNKLLHAEGIQYKSGNQWLLYAKYADKGYTVSGTCVVCDNSYVATYWTQEGRKFIYDLIKEKYGLTPRNEE